MKCLLAIPLALLMLFTGISVKFAAHYCSGHIAETHISLSGQLATCGMVHQSVNNSSMVIFTKHCCYDVISSYSIGNKFFPSVFNFPQIEQHLTQLLYIPEDNLLHQRMSIVTPIKNIRPPGANSPNDVYLPSLCTYLI
jgi:hypothetical protein